MVENDKPTGVDWSEWVFPGADNILNAIKADVAEVVIHQILEDLREERPNLVYADGKASVAFKLIGGEDVWSRFDIDSIEPIEADEIADLDAIISGLKRLIDRCESARTETAQKRPISTETNANEQRTEGD